MLCQSPVHKKALEHRRILRVIGDALGMRKLVMSFDAFLHSVFDHGRVSVKAPGVSEGDEEIAAAEKVLKAFEAEWRLDFPGAAPEWNHNAALYGARLLYRGARGVVFRKIDEGALRAGFDIPLPNDLGGSSTHYCVDLALRFLPDLTQLAKAASANDPLVEILNSLAHNWPLSSVGMVGVKPRSIESITGHPGLLRLYVDRILATGDISRLNNERVADAVRRAVGAHEELSSSISKLLPRGDMP